MYIREVSIIACYEALAPSLLCCHDSPVINKALCMLLTRNYQRVYASRNLLIGFHLCMCSRFKHFYYVHWIFLQCLHFDQVSSIHHLTLALLRLI